MTLKTWPTTLQPRAKLLRLGAESLSDAELLALFIRHGTSTHTALDIAYSLLNQHQHLANIVALTPQDYCQQPGAGIVSYCLLQGAATLSARYLQTRLQQQAIFTSPNDLKQFLANRLRNAKRECFACLFLDSQHCLLHFEILFQGTINYATVHTRIMAQQALRYNAAALVLAHNHPSGSTEISEADIALTDAVKRCMAWLDIKLLDHFIVANDRIVSLAEHGLL